MRQGHYFHEAARCRTQAQSFAGKPEQRLLLNLAIAFEELSKSGKDTREVAEDPRR